MGTRIYLTNGFKNVRETKRELFDKINESKTNFINVREELIIESLDEFSPERTVILEEISINLTHLISF